MSIWPEAVPPQGEAPGGTASGQVCFTPPPFVRTLRTEFLRGSDSRMSEETKTMKAGEDPADFKVADVVTFLESVEDPGEVARVLELEAAGKARAGVLSHVTPADPGPVTEAPTEAEQTAEPEPEPEPERPDETGTHEHGFIGAQSTKPDYSQANPDVMGG